MVVLRADDLWVKVTNEPRQAGSMTVVPGSMGFKQRDGKYINEWIDVLITDKTAHDGTPSKGDRISVTGRVDCGEYNGKKQWKVWADKVSAQGEPKQADAGPLPDDTDIPF